MAKPLLILLLVTTQLAAAGRGSVYLCIGNDGGDCCLYAGPDSCSCCRKEEEAQHVAYCNTCEHEHSGPLSRHHGNEKGQPGDGTLVAADSCDCTHIPVVISSAESRSAVRPSLSTNIAISIQLMALSALLGFDGGALAHPPMRWADPPAI